MQISLVIFILSYSVIDFLGPWLYHDFPSWLSIMLHLLLNVAPEMKAKSYNLQDMWCVCVHVPG